MSGAGESMGPDSSAGLVRRGSNRSSQRDDLLEDLLSHVMDVKFQTAPRHHQAPVNWHEIQDVENSARLPIALTRASVLLRTCMQRLLS